MLLSGPHPRSPKLESLGGTQALKKIFAKSPKLRTPALNYFTPLECKHQETKLYSMVSSKLTYKFTVVVIDLKRCW